MLILLLMISIAVNVLLIVKNKELKTQLGHLKKLRMNNSRINKSSNKNTVSQPLTMTAEPLEATQNYQLSEFELELDKEITLDEVQLDTEVHDTKKLSQPTQISQTERFLQSALQSLSGWHKSFIPFLLQNIGWFIGILCFISGSIFFVSYTEGLNKSVTIFYTILSYTLLLTWGGYHLKEKITHASISGMVLLAISFLLIPLNFSAAGRLLSIGLDNGITSTSFIIAVFSTLSASLILFYISKLIGGLYDRQLLSHFSLIFFSISALQLLIPVFKVSMSANQNLTLVLILFSLIMALLLFAFINYLPHVLKQVFVDKHYLLLFSVGTLIFSAMISMIHISLASPVTIAISYYAPVLLLISAVLFYSDEILNTYEDKGSLLSYLSMVSYVVSFAAIFLSFDSSLMRLIVMSLSLMLYVRLMWLYRSLVPLTLVIVLTSFLYVDSFLIDQNFMLTITVQWLYISLLPLFMLLAVLFYMLRKSETQREKSFILTRHLLHFIIACSVLFSVMSQWAIQAGSLTWLAGFIPVISLYYVLKSKTVNAIDLLGVKINTLYCYLLTMLLVLMVLSNQLIGIESKLVLLVLISLFYSLNSVHPFVRLSSSPFYRRGIEGVANQRLERSIFINSTLMINLLLIVLIGLGFNVSIKISLLLFVIALNSLFLSLNLYNRALFYIFMLFLSLSAFVLKLHLNDVTSTGLLLVSLVFLLFYLISYLEKHKNTQQESMHSNKIHQKMPDKLLWFYPVNDSSDQLIINGEGSQNV